MSKQSDLVGVSQGSAGDPLYVDSTNNKVGIGTSSPDTTLNIGFSGADQSNALRIEGSNGSSERYALDIEADGEYAKTNFKIGVGGGAPTTRMTIDSSGRVGIGTSSPSEPLMVNGNIFASTGDGGGYKLEGNSGIFRQGITGMGFNTNGSEAMRIDSSGNVGIGTDSPSSKMHLQNTSGGSEGYLKVTDAAWGGDVRFGMADGVDNDAIAGVWSNNRFRFYTNSTERMRIDSSGHVTMPYQPAFDVSYSGSGYSAAGTVIFDTVHSNVGGYYSTSTGRFTAPVSGSYLFYTTYIKNGDTTTGRRRFDKNGSQYGGGRHLRLDDGQQFGDNGVLQAIIYLNAGDFVYVNQFAGSSYGSNEYDYFGGYLIG